MRDEHTQHVHINSISTYCSRHNGVIAKQDIWTDWRIRFAVKAGAKHVIGVDMSTIIVKAREIVAANGMSDKITLLQGKMEEVTLPFPEVDIIISEWMGYFLLYESMLDTVLWARDRYLRKDGQGLIFPDKATIFMAGIEDGEYKDEKIGCKPHHLHMCDDFSLMLGQSGTTSTASTTRPSSSPPSRSPSSTPSTSKPSSPTPAPSSPWTSTQSRPPTSPSRSPSTCPCAAPTTCTP